MKKYLFLILFCFINTIYGCSQTNEKFHITPGMFICRANQYLIYMENEDVDCEWPTYTIKSINLNTDEKVVLDKQTINKCVSLSDTAILYIKGAEIILWNLELNKKMIFYKADKDLSLIGVCYNKNTLSLLITQINFKTGELSLKILNDKKQTIFCQKMEVNNMEIEGVVPVLETLNNFFVLSVQDKLYILDSKQLDLKLVSDKCDGYALNNRKVIYYKFVTDEKSKGYSFDLITKENEIIDNLLNEQIFNCEKSFLFTTNIDNNFIPIYIICNKPYAWISYKWQIVPNIVIYKDSKLVIKMPFTKDIINDNCFQWELQ